MSSRLLLALCLACLTLPALASKPVVPDSIPGTLRVNAEQVVELVLSTPKLVVVDTRHADEYVKGHIEGAINLLDTRTTSGSLGKLTHGKDIPVLFYCNGEHCPRSSNASKIAVNLGYKKVYWFRGGWNEWVEKQMPITK